MEEDNIVVNVEDLRTLPFQIFPYVVDIYGRTLGAEGIAVYVALVRTAMHTGRCRLTVREIGDIWGESEYKVRKGLKALQKTGLVEVLPQFRNNEQIANEYVLIGPLTPFDNQSPPLRLSKTDTTTTSNGNIISFFLDNLHGNIGPIDIDYLYDLEDTLGIDVVYAAIKEAAISKGADKRLVGVKYIGVIAARMAREGIDAERKTHDPLDSELRILNPDGSETIV